LTVLSILFGRVLEFFFWRSETFPIWLVCTLFESLRDEYRPHPGNRTERKVAGWWSRMNEYQIDSILTDVSPSWS
jgi:hypothetical protein